MPVQLYDTTLRDGVQREGLSFSLEDKLKIARRLDRLGIAYVEGGWPGSNPKDMAFFERVPDIGLEQATVSAFGSTRRVGVAVEDDGNIHRLWPSWARAGTCMYTTYYAPHWKRTCV
jgi:2-isopropylmalate synthase